MSTDLKSRRRLGSRSSSGAIAPEAATSQRAD
jgi:hypothetical protein